MIRPLKPKDLKAFIYFCQTRDKFSDFYITKDNKRFYLNNLKIAKQVFKDCLKCGDKCYIKEENGIINALLLIVGYKNHFERKYIKILTENKNHIRDLLQYLQWQQLSNLFIKARKNNSYLIQHDRRLNKYKPTYFLRKAGFKIIVERQSDILLKKEDIYHGFRKHNNKRN